jgi:amino acid transporter
MAETSTTPSAPTMKATLGLTGLTVNAMALIAPGAFLWLTTGEQCLYGAPTAGMSIWIGIVGALLLCLATAVSYAELSKLYPGAGSSYVFAEQAFLRKHKAFKYARLVKFVIGWSSHLYYWIYPGVMVGVTAIMVGYVLGVLFPSVFNSAIPSPLFMYGFCVIFSFGVAYIAWRGVTGATSVNLAINIIQITALLIFSAIAFLYRTSHSTEGAPAWTLDPNGLATNVVIATDKDGNPVTDKDGNFVAQKDAKGNPVPYTLTWAASAAMDKGSDPKNPTDTFEFHTTAASVVSLHKPNYAIIQACVAILILVGFESVSAMGEEAKNPTKDIPKAIILSLIIQGAFCYLLEYFCALYFLNSGYTMTQAGGSSAPIGDMMQITGAWFFGSIGAGRAFMLVEAFTVFLALIGTTLSCMSTGARVTYAMGRDEEMGAHFGLLHEKNLTPSRAIWTLAVLSAVIGIFSVAFYYCGPGAQSDATIKALPQNFWYSFGLFSNATALKIPQSMLVVTLASNFGTFLLYMLTNIIAIVAFNEHHSFHGFKHVVIPVFGLIANFGCMLFYLIGPFTVAGMSWKEPFVALGVALLWGIYGIFYFLGRSKAAGKTVLLTEKPTTV